VEMLAYEFKGGEIVQRRKTSSKTRKVSGLRRKGQKHDTYQVGLWNKEKKEQVVGPKQQAKNYATHPRDQKSIAWGMLKRKKGGGN